MIDLKECRKVNVPRRRDSLLTAAVWMMRLGLLVCRCLNDVVWFMESPFALLRACIDEGIEIAVSTKEMSTNAGSRKSESCMRR